MRRFEASYFVAVLMLILPETGAANVFPCGGEPARTYDDSPAPVRHAAQAGRVLVGAGLGVPVGTALAAVGVPIGAATGPLWLNGDDAVGQGAVWGVCPGLLTVGAFADLGYHLFGGPAYGFSRLFGERPGVTMVLLERSGCFGKCPQYSVRVTKDGTVQFDGEYWIKEPGHREGKLSANDFQRLVQAVEVSEFDQIPSEFPADACEEVATCAPTVWITVMKDSTLKRVAYYFGCKGSRFGAQFARIIELGDAIDKIVGTSRWIGEEAERRPSRCLQYEPDVVSLEGIMSYRTFVDANGRSERSPMLLLNSPICLDDAADGLNVAEEDQLLLHLDMDPKKFGEEKALSGRRVVATGSIYHGITAHHHAPLMLWVERLEVKESDQGALIDGRDAAPPE